jgi:hypothetical protein
MIIDGADRPPLSRWPESRVADRSLDSSSRRKPRSSERAGWIPAFAGMTREVGAD